MSGAVLHSKPSRDRKGVVASETYGHTRQPPHAAQPRHETCSAATMPMISVVTPSFNQGRFIEHCIRRVMEQGYPRFEHIVCDNCSSDETLSVLRRYPHVKWTSEPDRGQSHALNKAIARARGEIIAWINADDFYEPGAFDAAAAALSGDTVAVAGAVEVVDCEGAVLETLSPRFDGIDGMVEFWDGGYGLCQPGLFFKRSIFERIEPLRSDLHFAMDYDLWLRIAQRWPIETMDRVLARYVVHPASKTGAARFGAGFNEELERVSRSYWGARFSRRHRRLARGCRRFIAEQFMNAVVFTHNRHNRIDWASLRGLLRRRPSLLFRRHMTAVAIERIIGVDRWNRIKRKLRIKNAE